MKTIKDYIKSIPDFPKKGIIFRDVTSILQDADGLKLAVDELCALLGGVEFDLIAGPESRGFIFGVPVAYALHKAFVPIRKKGKLPRETISVRYDLEYGSEEIEVHRDAILPGQKVVIIDDLIATGGTSRAMIDLVEALGGEVVMFAFVIELEDLGGRAKLAGYRVESIARYEGE
ncbi:MAG: adenine phosphoribosyltransferase [Lachnospiraceae bacterium]|jgi:adenine phosphoribosyltransferase|nr:adenine phosphoribosyltransferase [Lachnospiraceae bacterium]